MQALTDLNKSQRRAVEAADGPVIVIAGPGTGKTKTLTARIAYLLQDKNIKPQEILALTFTKKAAEEMQTRVAALVDNALAPKITTFHGLCHELIGGDQAFVSEPERLQIIKSLRRPAAFKHLSVREFGLLISRAKNTLDVQDKEIANVVAAYNDALRAKNLRDFDDLLLDAYGLLRTDGPKKSYRYIFVDEFQDTNRLQYEILKLLLTNQNLFIIGDPNQSIYGFRGASGTILAQCKADFPAYTEITLTTNYRSAPKIVQLSNAIFPAEPALEPSARAPQGKACAVQVLNEYSEAEWVLSQVQRAIGGGDFLRAVSDDDRSLHRSLRDFAILYRSRSAAIALQKAVDASGLPYQIVGEGSPYEKPLVQAIIGLMRAAAQNSAPNLPGFSTLQARQAAELLKEYKTAAPADFTGRAATVLDAKPSRELSQFTAIVTKFETIEEAVRYFDAIAENGFYDPQADAITLLTIHASKGLEFPCVFLIGAQEGILPSERGDLAEEHRLFYVAVTRAKEWIEILYAKNRSGQHVAASSFLESLSSEVLERCTDPDMENQAKRIAKRQAKRSQQSLF